MRSFLVGLSVLVGVSWVVACDDDAATTEGAAAQGGAGAASQGTTQGGGGSGQGGMAAGGAGTGGDGGSAGPMITLPTPNARFDYQLGGAYPPPRGVTMVGRDRSEGPAAGLYSVCYVNGFQAQQAEDAWWLDNHPTLVLRDDGGNPIIDPDWDEMLLDTSTPEKRAELATIVGDWIAGCSASGYQAVEIDNLDSYSRSQGKLVEQDAVSFVALLAARAHAEGVAIAQKNALELLDRRVEMGTDFAVVEECNRYSECQPFADAYGDRVFIIEYRQQDFTKGCSDYPNLSVVYRDLDLQTPSDSGYIFDDC